MKINGGSIFGVTLVAVGLLFALWGMTARNEGANPSTETGNVWYYVLAGGLVITGLLIALLSQALTRSPPAEIGSTKEDPKP